MNSSQITVSVFNSADPDHIEPIDSLGVVLANPETVVSGVTDRSGIFCAILPVGKYLLNLLDPVFSQTTIQNTPYLLDYPINVIEKTSLFINIQIDSSQVEYETDIPGKLNITVRIINEKI